MWPWSRLLDREVLGSRCGVERGTAVGSAFNTHLARVVSLKSALTVVNGAAMDTTVEVTDDGGLHSAVADLAMGATLVLCPAWPKGASQGENPWESSLSSKFSLARLGPGTTPNL